MNWDLRMTSRLAQAPAGTTPEFTTQTQRQDPVSRRAVHAPQAHLPQEGNSSSEPAWRALLGCRLETSVGQRENQHSGHLPSPASRPGTGRTAHRM